MGLGGRGWDGDKACAQRTCPPSRSFCRSLHTRQHRFAKHAPTCRPALQAAANSRLVDCGGPAGWAVWVGFGVWVQCLPDFPAPPRSLGCVRPLTGNITLRPGPSLLFRTSPCATTLTRTWTRRGCPSCASSGGQPRHQGGIYTLRTSATLHTSRLALSETRRSRRFTHNGSQPTLPAGRLPQP